MADPRAGIERMRTALVEVGRDPTRLRVQGGLPVSFTEGGVDLEATLAPVSGLVEAGVTDFSDPRPVRQRSLRRCESAREPGAGVSGVGRAKLLSLSTRSGSPARSRRVLVQISVGVFDQPPSRIGNQPDDANVPPSTGIVTPVT